MVRAIIAKALHLTKALSRSVFSCIACVIILMLFVIVFYGEVAHAKQFGNDKVTSTNEDRIIFVA